MAHAAPCAMRGSHRQQLPPVSFICSLVWLTCSFITRSAATQVLVRRDAAAAAMSGNSETGRRRQVPSELCGSWAQKVPDEVLDRSDHATTSAICADCRLMHENACDEFWEVGKRWACYKQCLALSYDDDNKDWCIANALPLNQTATYTEITQKYMGAVNVMDKLKDQLVAGMHSLEQLWTYVPGSDGTYAQNYQDQWIAAVARHNGWDRSSGFFLDLGAYDGLKCSNTALIEKNFGWRGICVEPRPLPYAFSQRSCILVARPLSDVTGRIVSFSGVPGTQLQRITTRHHDIFSEDMTTLNGRDLVRCLNSTGESAHEMDTCHGVPRGQQIPSFINFISLDIEGQGAAFLRTFPYDLIQVGAWIVEKPGDEARSILKKNGYIRVPVQNPGVDQYFIQPRFWSETLAQKKWREHPEGSFGC
mmetsp:Transcript_83117/g.144407  ORF Transcript_83117/g.144407 Transcript_83117/m.144407 type:complete len:420 (+) Transcript_83117:44-1303(+)